MRLPAKIFAASSLVALALVGVAAWSLVAVGQLVRAQREIVDRSLPAIQLEHALRAAIPRLLRLEARHVALGEGAYGALLAEHADGVAADLARLGGLVTSPAERDLHGRATTAFAAYRAQLEAAQALLAQRRTAEAARVSGGAARTAADQLDRTLAELVTVTAAELARAQAAAVQLEQRTWGTVLTALGGGVIAALGVSAIVALRVTRSLRRLSAATARVADGSFADPLPVVTRDEVGELTQSFNAMAAELRAHEAQKRQFFAHVSHELRNPLTAIRSACQLMVQRMGSALEPKQRRWLELIDGSVDRLLAMVNEILSWNRLRAGVFPLERRRVGLDDVVTRAVEMLRPLADQEGLTLRSTRDGSDFALVADEAALDTIVGNLVGNALKFTPRGGSVAVGIADAGAEVELTVRDDGPGIAAEDAARIFEPYQQAHQGRNGSGLGLAIVRELVTAHGGTVGLDTAEGRGTCFTVRLPRGAAALEPAHAA